MRAIIAGRVLNAAAIALASLYLVALLPVTVAGCAANADYHDRGCLEAMQCGDAGLMMTFALIYVLAGPVVWLVFKLLRKAAGAVRMEEDA